jgi:hypothetical protein
MCCISSYYGQCVKNAIREVTTYDTLENCFRFRNCPSACGKGQSRKYPVPALGSNVHLWKDNVFPTVAEDYLGNSGPHGRKTLARHGHVGDNNIDGLPDYVTTQGNRNRGRSWCEGYPAVRLSISKATRSCLTHRVLKTDTGEADITSSLSRPKK